MLVGAKPVVVAWLGVLGATKLFDSQAAFLYTLSSIIVSLGNYRASLTVGSGGRAFFSRC